MAGAYIVRPYSCLFLYCMAHQQPVQKASTQRHGKPALKDIWEGFRTIRSYCTELFRNAQNLSWKDLASFPSDNKVLEVSLSVNYWYVPNTGMFDCLSIPKLSINICILNLLKLFMHLKIINIHLSNWISYFPSFWFVSKLPRGAMIR